MVQAWCTPAAWNVLLFILPLKKIDFDKCSRKFTGYRRNSSFHTTSRGTEYLNSLTFLFWSALCTQWNLFALFLCFSELYRQQNFLFLDGALAEVRHVLTSEHDGLLNYRLHCIQNKHITKICIAFYQGFFKKLNERSYGIKNLSKAYDLIKAGGTINFLLKLLCSCLYYVILYIRWYANKRTVGP